MQRDWLMTMSRLRAVLVRAVLLRPVLRAVLLRAVLRAVLRCTDCVSSWIDTRHRSPPTRSDVSLTCSPASTTDASTNTGTPPRAGTGSLELTPPVSKSGMCSRSRGLGLETVSRTNNVSSRSRLGQSAQRLGLGPIRLGVSSRSRAILCRWSRRFMRRARSVAQYSRRRPIQTNLP